MATATETLESNDVALATTENSKPTKPKKAGGRPAGYSPMLPFSTTKTVKGLAESAFKEFKALGDRCSSGDTTSDELVDLLTKQADACLEVRKTASLMWLTQGMLLHTLKDKVKSDGGQWMTFFDEHLSHPLNLSPRSEQLQRKMYTDWYQSMSVLPEQTARALQECEQVNDLAGHLKKLSAGRDPWDAAPESETPTLVDESAKKRQAKLKQVKKLADELGDLGYPLDVVQIVNELFDAMQAATIDVGAVQATETIDVVIEEPHDVLADAIGSQLESMAA